VTNDESVTLQDLKNDLTRFRDDRDWQQFHNSKDLAIAVAAEAAELLEHFLWKTPEDVKEQESDPEKVAAIAEELSDVLILTLLAFDRLSLDVSSTVRRKIAKNSENYPTDVSRGSSVKRKMGVEQ
jgi:dCTP diphosphatase